MAGYWLAITTEEVWGWSQLAGAVLALVALALAGLSWRQARSAANDAKASREAATRTAIAAEKTAAAAEELARVATARPNLALSGSVEMNPEPFPVLTLALSNTGTRDVRSVNGNLWVPNGLLVDGCNGPHTVGGSGVPSVPGHQPPVKPEGSTEADWNRVDFQMEALRGVRSERHFRIRDRDNPPDDRRVCAILAYAGQRAVWIGEVPRLDDPA